MPVITVEMLEGRTQEQKRALAAALTDAFLETCGSRREAVYVIIREVPKEHWAVGGTLHSDR